MNDEQQQKLTQLYRASRQEQPSTALDGKIRNAARRAVMPRRDSWLWRLSTAAVLVLSFTVVINLLWLEPEFNGDGEMQPLSMPPAPAAPQVEMEQSLDMADAAPAAKVPSAIAAQSRQRMKEEISKARKSSTERMLSAPASVAEIASGYVSEAGPVEADEDTSATLYVPQLPVTEQQLVALAPGLVAETSANGSISLYADNKLILTVSSPGGSAMIKAWQGAQLLGVKLDWTMAPAQLQACRAGVVYTACDLGGGVSGYFEGDRLDYIEWSQVDD